MGSTGLSTLRGPALAPPPSLEGWTLALFADLDGTLAPIEETPDAVRPDPARRRLLEALETRLGGRLAVVSGRSLADLDVLLEGRVMAVAALHGLERRRADGELLRAADPQATRAALETVRDFAKADRRLLVEDKGLSVALHFRRAPEDAEACRELAHRLGAQHGLKVQAGDMVVELRAPGPDKGAAVEAFMREAPFAGATPVFLGDDLTDEDGFAAVRALGGVAIIVGERRPTKAQYALPDVAAAQAWLARLAEEPG